MINNFLPKKGSKYRGIIFLSGSGSNAEKILEYIETNKSDYWEPVGIVTDRPETSRGKEIAKRFNLPLIEHDIKKFYNKRGEERISIMSERGREIRNEWTDALREKLKPIDVDFGILAGFVPLTNITSDFPCLNVHPGDLTVEENGKRILVGLHTIPIETAIIKGLTTLRSSVIVAQTYTGSGGEMDSGPILGVSTPVKIDFENVTYQELLECNKNRPPKRPIGGYKDILEQIATKNQNKLKENGDWIVFPQVINDFASGIYKYDSSDNLYICEDRKCRKIKTVEYGKSEKNIIEL